MYRVKIIGTYGQPDQDHRVLALDARDAAERYQRELVHGQRVEVTQERPPLAANIPAATTLFEWDAYNSRLVELG